MITERTEIYVISCKCETPLAILVHTESIFMNNTSGYDFNKFLILQSDLILYGIILALFLSLV